MEDDVFQAIIPLRGVEETVEETVEESVEIILGLIRNNPSVTAREMQEPTGLSRRGVEYKLKKLKTAGKIRRIGPTKGGHWEIVE